MSPLIQAPERMDEVSTYDWVTANMLSPKGCKLQSGKASTRDSASSVLELREAVLDLHQLTCDGGDIVVVLETKAGDSMGGEGGLVGQERPLH